MIFSFEEFVERKNVEFETQNREFQLYNIYFYIKNNFIA